MNSDNNETESSSLNSSMIPEPKKRESKLSFLDSHTSNNDEPEMECEDQFESPQYCGKIGKRTSRFSVYGQENKAMDYKNYIKNNPNPEGIMEVNESEISESSPYPNEMFKNSSCSDNQNSSYYETNSSHKNLSEDYENGKLRQSKYQEKMLNHALRSCSKFSLDGSGVMKKSTFKSGKYKSVNETGFGKKKNEMDNNSNDNKSNRISIEKQLSGFKPNSSNNFINSPVPKMKEMSLPDDPYCQNNFQNIKIVKNFFSKKTMQDNSYRDSCDVNLAGTKSAIKFFEHWKLQNNEDDENEDNKTRFKNNDKSSKNNQKESKLSNLMKSEESDDGNYFDIYASDIDAKSIKNSNISNRNLSIISKNNNNSNNNSPKTNEKERKSKIYNKSRTSRISKISSGSNNKSQIKSLSQLSRDSKFGNDLLSDLMINSETNEYGNMTGYMKQDSINVDNNHVMNDRNNPSKRRISQNNDDRFKKNKKSDKENNIKRKYSLIGFKTSARSKAFPKKTFDKNIAKGNEFDEWNTNDRSKQLLTMLSTNSNNTITSTINTQSDNLSWNEDLKLNSSEVIMNKKTDEDDIGAGSMLFIKKKAGNTVGFKSSYSPEKKKSIVKSSSLINSNKMKNSDIQDNKKNLFEISKDPSDFSNLLGIKLHKI